MKNAGRICLPAVFFPVDSPVLQFRDPRDDFARKTVKLAFKIFFSLSLLLSFFFYIYIYIFTNVKKIQAN